MNLYKEFKDKIRYQLQKDIWKKNIHQIPQIDKIIVSMWIWSLVTRKWLKDFSELENNLAIITWQKAFMIKSKKAISNFKLREDMPVMLKTTLRREKAYDFIERLVNLVFPRVRDFEWLTEKKFDWNGNYNIWYKDLTPFPEINPEDLILPMGVQINIVTTADTDDDAKSLLESLWILFIKK